MAMYTMFRSNPDATVDEIEEHMDGNICRCTGYRPIWDSAKSLCSDSRKGPCGESCKSCPEKDECEIEKAHEMMEKARAACTPNNIGEKNYGNNCCSSSNDKYKNDPKFNKSYRELNVRETPFPEELATATPTPFLIYSGQVTWFSPVALDDLLKLKARFPSSRIVVGNTEVGIEIKFKNAVYPQLISGSNVSELKRITETDKEYIFGSCTPLSDIAHYCETKKDDAVCSSFHNMLRWFASTQIRNTASLAGNLATASPISDMNPMLAASNAVMTVMSDQDGARTVFVKDFFLSYRRTDLKPHEVIVDVRVPKPRQFEYILPFKQAKRREDDISIVTAGIRVKLGVSADGKSFVVEESAMAFGGMSFKTVTAPKTSAFLLGKEWNADTITAARVKLAEDLPLPDNVPGGQPEYRRTLAASFLFKFFVATSINLAEDIAANGIDGPKPPVVEEVEKSAAISFVTQPKPSMSGSQRFPKPKITPGLEVDTHKADEEPKSTPSASGAGLPSTHQSGALHCTGEAKYCDDISLPAGTLQGVLIHATQASCDLKSVDIEMASKMPGVIKIVLYDDLAKVGGSNKLGPVMKDEEVFATKRIRHVGQVIGIVMAETLDQAHKACNTVKVEYENEDDDIIVSIDKAIEAKSFYPMTDHTIEVGDIESALKTTDAVVIEGTYRVGQQEHFYLETMSSLCVPTEGNTGMVVYSSTQAPTKTQNFCASASNLPASRVVCKMKRMGGGFGGKETRSVFVAAACAVGARITGRPVRVTLDRNVDMQTTGQRHSFVAKYKAAAKVVDGKPKLLGLDVNIWSNGGCSLDLSGPVMDRALFHIDGTYNWGSLRAHGVVCKTIQPPHTAYRGFGGPQGIIICENVIDHLAREMGIDGSALRAANFYKEGEKTHFRQVFEKGTWNVPRAFSDVQAQAGYHERLTACEEFNAKNKWRKRGVAVVPTKFGIAFTAKFMNQGGALVHVYQDGTVLVSHGGTEMGQGLHTKVCQVAATAFGISIDKVYIDDTSTDKVANTIPTAASMSTDMYGMACLDACQQILKRLEPVRAKLGKEAPLSEIATAAHFERIDLSAHGFYALANERCGYDWTKPMEERGRPFNYFTQGAAFSEVEVDVLTGDHRIVRADVVVDVGSSINPAIDIGQIEGAFVQGAGWSTTEEMIWGDEEHEWVRPKGRLFTQGPGFYKPPAFNDMPSEFNVTLMDGVANKFAVMSSKAIGEPPFFLGSVVYFAVKNALESARKDCGKDGPFRLDHPATSERIRMAVPDEIAQAAGGGADFCSKGSY